MSTRLLLKFLRQSANKTPHFEKPFSHQTSCPTICTFVKQEVFLCIRIYPLCNFRQCFRKSCQGEARHGQVDHKHIKTVRLLLKYFKSLPAVILFFSFPENSPAQGYSPQSAGRGENQFLPDPPSSLRCFRFRGVRRKSILSRLSRKSTRLAPSANLNPAPHRNSRAKIDTIVLFIFHLLRQNRLSPVEYCRLARTLPSKFYHIPHTTTSTYSTARTRIRTAETKRGYDSDPVMSG